MHQKRIQPSLRGEENDGFTLWLKISLMKYTQNWEDVGQRGKSRGMEKGVSRPRIANQITGCALSYPLVKPAMVTICLRAGKLFYLTP